MFGFIRHQYRFLEMMITSTPKGNIWMTQRALIDSLSEKGYTDTIEYLTQGVSSNVRHILLNRAIRRGLLRVSANADIILRGGNRLISEKDAKNIEEFNTKYNSDDQFSHRMELAKVVDIIGLSRAKSLGLVVLDPFAGVIPDIIEKGGYNVSNDPQTVDEFKRLHRIHEKYLKLFPYPDGHNLLSIQDEESLEKSRVFYQGVPIGKRKNPPFISKLSLSPKGM